MKKQLNLQSGQSVVTLIVFIMIFISIITMSIVMIGVNSLAANDFQQGITARQIADSGVEEALLRLLRNPDYPGETLPLGGGSAIITVTGGQSDKTVVSIGSLGNSRKTIRVNVHYNDIMTISSWQEEL